jgi:hypothetical protein
MPPNRFNGYTDYGVGIGLRVPHYQHIFPKKQVVDWFEIISENYTIDGWILVAQRRRMLKIQRTSNEHVVLSLSGRMDEEHIAELKAPISSEAKGRRIVLDLKNLTLAGQEVISFLERCEADGIALLNCAPYVREWITGMRVES